MRNHSATIPSTRTATALTPARIAFVAAAASVLLLAALHVLSPEIDPAWRMVSEYAVGHYAWVLALMFLAQALGCAALFFAIKPAVQTLGGKIGLGFLLAAALGLAMAAVFDFTHNLHGLSALIGIPSLPIAAVLTSHSLVRGPAWAAARRRLLPAAHLTWMSLVLMFAALFIGLSQTGGEFGPSVLIGWPNRLLVVSYAAWLMAVAWSAGRQPAREG